MNNDSDSLESMMKPMMAIMMIAIMGTLVTGMLTPAAGEFTCPICGISFYSLADLESHFTTAHPSTPITIIWD